MSNSALLSLAATLVCAVIGLFTAFAGLIAHKAAKAASNASMACERMLRLMEVREAVAAAGAVQMEAERAQHQASELSRAYGLMGLYSSTKDDTDVHQLQLAADAKADLAGEIAAHAQRFIAARNDLEETPVHDIDRSLTEFQHALSEIRRLRKEVEEEQSNVARKHTTYT
jgi:hypothetical protein